MKTPREKKNSWALIIFLAIVLAGGYFSYTRWFGSQRINPETTRRQSAAPEAYIKLLSPSGGEVWIKTKSYYIDWAQKELEGWGNKLIICLVALDTSESLISPNDQKSSCYLYAKAYFLAEVKVTDRDYKWKIPADIYSVFEKNPTTYKIVLLVFDERPPEARPAWAGLVAKDESDENFIIVVD